MLGPIGMNAEFGPVFALAVLIRSSGHEGALAFASDLARPTDQNFRRMPKATELEPPLPPKSPNPVER